MINLGDGPYDETATAQIATELEAIGATIYPNTVGIRGPHGILNGWELRRLWYYYSVSSDAGMPESKARAMNKQWCEDIRVEGFAGGNLVSGVVQNYHIDTPEGLAHFAAVVREIPQ